jgi:hypothetical protein
MTHHLLTGRMQRHPPRFPATRAVVRLGSDDVLN